MSSKTIKTILIVLGVISAIGLVIYGANLGSDMAGYRDNEFLYGFLGLIIGGVVGFGVLVSCFAIGNALSDLERTADATEEIAYLLKHGDSQISKSANHSSSISKLSAINNNEHYVSDSWTCKKCGRVNLKADMTCKDCGEYK